MSKFITLTKLQNREPTLLQTVIDNTCGKLNIALKSFHYEVGYHNLDPSATFGCASSSQVRRSLPLYGGMYTFEQISRFLMESVPGITLRLDIRNQTELDIPDSITVLTLDKTLVHFLGLESLPYTDKIRAYTYFYPNKYAGRDQVKLIVHKWLYIYLDQLSTTSNIVDGAPSTLLAIVPASANKGIINITPSNPMFKKLAAGHIHQLNLRVLDENDKVVQNHGKPMTAILEIRENA